MSEKNLVYNKLPRQNIFLALLMQFRFLLFWLAVIIIYKFILILITVNIDFIVLLLLLYFIFVTVIMFIVVSIINAFILIYLMLFLIVHVTMTFLCVTCDMYVSHHFFKKFLFPFLFNDLHFILALLIYVKNHFYLAMIVYIIIVIITTILFFSTLPVIGGEFIYWIRAAWSTPTHWLLWVSRRVSIIFIFIYFICFVSCSLVTTVEMLMPSFIFII